MIKKLEWIENELQGLKEAGLYNRIRTLSSPQGAWLVVDGKRVLNFCSNNYLGLANHPRLLQAARQAMEKYGLGPAAVRSIAGTMDLHLELERRMAAFKGVEAAITFQSGFNANMAAIPALVGKDDAIFSDELNHASIIDGCRLSGAKIIRYAHCDPGDLERVLKENRAAYPRVMVITDGVFSMDGDIAPLDQIYDVVQNYEAILMVDDAHGEGVLGRGGRGIVDHFDLHGKVDVEVGTMSKAFGVVGGVVAGNPVVVEWLRQRGRPFLFSSAMTVPDAAACLAALDLLEEFDRTGGPAVGERPLLQSRDEAPGLRHRQEQHPDHPGHAGRSAAGAAVQPRAVRKWRLCHGDRLPHRPAWQSAHPGDDLRLPLKRRPGSGPGGF